MRVFELTRIRITVWYVLIIMTLSSMFSFVIYKGVVKNITASFKNAEARFDNNQGPQAMRMLAENRGISSESAREVLHNLLLDELESSKQNVLFYLVITNLIIIIFSSLVSYYLAGKTLIPIEEIINEQKRFITDASHELKTPLTSLKTSIEVSIRSGKLPKDIHKLFQYNLEDVNALNQLIDKLLSLSSLEDRRLIFDNLDISEVIRTALKRVRYLSDQKKIKIKVSTKNYQIKGEESSLIELFVILLDNAIKYSNKNGQIDIVVKSAKNHLIISVKDSGIGIDQKYLPNIFDRFYRINSARTLTAKSSFGLGLSVAKKVVENHKGSISVSSEIAKGTVFTIKLPIKS
ncbi:MAG: GHKL domain-containing protein [Pseudomonadales bacterium]|nr:GHKL domain-containing protein [Pseudomonadales bacterium]